MQKAKLHIIVSLILLFITMFVCYFLMNKRLSGAYEESVEKADGKVIMLEHNSQKLLSEYDYSLRMQKSMFTSEPVVLLYDNIRGTLIKTTNVSNVEFALRNVPKEKSVIFIYGPTCDDFYDQSINLALGHFVRNAEMMGYKFQESEFTLCACEK